MAAACLSTLLLVRRQSLWFDEAFTAAVGPLPVGDIVRAVVTGEGPVRGLADTPPSYNGPYYLVVHGWLAITGMAPAEIGLRSLSSVAFVCAVGLLTVVLVRLLGQVWGLLAAGAVATNPFLVEYSAEARPYMLALLASSGALLVWTAWMEAWTRSAESGESGESGEPGGSPKRRWVLAFAACGAAATSMHWYAGLVLVALVVLTWRVHRDRLVPVAGAAAVGCLPVVLLAGVALLNGVGTSGASWIRALEPETLPDLIREIAGFRNPLVLAMIGGLVLAVWHLRGDRARRLIVVVVGVPLVIVIVVSIVVQPVLVPRYLITAVALVPALAMTGMAELPGRWKGVGATALLVASVHASAGVIGALPRENTADAVAAVHARRATGDPIVAPARWEALVVSRYEPAVVTPEDPLSERIQGAGTVWVVRLRRGGLPGDTDKRSAAVATLTGAGFAPVEDLQFKGREYRVVVERWTRPT